MSNIERLAADLRLELPDQLLRSRGALDHLSEADIPMTRLLTDQALVAALRGRGLERSRHFSWREAADRTLAVYREAVGGTAG